MRTLNIAMKLLKFICEGNLREADEMLQLLWHLKKLEEFDNKRIKELEKFEKEEEKRILKLYKN